MDNGKVGRSPLRGSGLRPSGGAVPSPAEPLVPNADPALAWRVAMAIYCEYENRPLYAQGQMNGVLAAELAVAAIRAMREPTDAMIEAAALTPGMKAASGAMVMHQARGYGFDAGAFEDGSPLHQAWRAMIDAATVPVIDAMSAASGMEAASAGETLSGSTVGDSPVPKADAQ